MTFEALDADGAIVRQRTYYSVGGGFVVDEDAVGADRVKVDNAGPVPVLVPAGSCSRSAPMRGCGSADVMLANELSWRTEEQIRAGLLRIWRVMTECVERGCSRDGILPGGLRVPRRAPGLYQDLMPGPVTTTRCT